MLKNHLRKKRSFVVTRSDGRRVPTSTTATDEEWERLGVLSQAHGISKAALLSLAIQRLGARRVGRPHDPNPLIAVALNLDLGLEGE